MIDPARITGLVLAGGEGSRMGGLDKGLQPFRGVPLALNALQRLTPQVGTAIVIANRNLAAYAAFGVPVWPDLPDAAGTGESKGPLAGFLAGLSHCSSPYLLTVPCDVPFFPMDLAARMAAAMEKDDAEVVVATLHVPDNPPRPQPVFSMMRAELQPSLARFMAAGGRKPGAWTAGHRTRLAHFDRPADRLAFANVNTPHELEELQGRRLLPG